MKKLIILICSALIATSVLGATVSNTVAWNVPWGDAWRLRAEKTLDSFVTQINSDSSDPSVDTIAVSGKSTLNGELEVNNSDVDINMTLTGNEIDITQTNEAGTANAPLVKITDARTGATANTAGEATLVITPSGTHAVSVTAGISALQALEATTVTASSTVDATAYTANAGSGIDAKTAGALDVGNTTATSIDYGSSAVTVHTFVSDGTGDSEIVLPLLSIGDGEINDMAASKLTGNIAEARLTNAAGSLGDDIDGANITGLDADNIATGNLSTNIGGAGTLTGILKATAGVVAPAVADTDYCAVASVYGSSTAVNGDIASGQLIVTNAITMKDIAGSTLAAYTLTHVWMSETAAGSATTNNIETLALSTGAAVATVIANAEYWYVTAVGGTAVATITATATGTNYINIGVGPRVTSTEIIFLP